MFNLSRDRIIIAASILASASLPLAAYKLQKYYSRWQITARLTSEHGLNVAEISSLNNYEKGFEQISRVIENNDFKRRVEQKYLKEIIPSYNSAKYSPIGTGTAPNVFHFTISPNKESPSISFDHKQYNKNSYYTNFYFEIDTTPNFNSPLLWRYPNLTPDFVSGGNRTYIKNIFNPSQVTLYLHNAGTRKMFTPGKIEFPFPAQVMLAKFSPNRREFDIDNLRAVSYLLTENMDAKQRQLSVYNFVKLNLIWGGDTRSRGPIESFTAKVVGCGHMNGVAGLLLEFAGDHSRVVSGFDPLARVEHIGGGVIRLWRFIRKIWAAGLFSTRFSTCTCRERHLWNSAGTKSVNCMFIQQQLAASPTT